MIPLTDVIRAAARTLDFTDAEFPDAGATLGDEHRIRELLTGAGFSNIQARLQHLLVGQWSWVLSTAEAQPWRIHSEPEVS